MVEKGDPILSFDTEKIDKELAQAENALELSEIALEQAKVKVASLEKTVPLDLAAAERAAKVAKEDLDYFFNVEKDQRQESARRSLKYAEFSLEYAQEELNQLEQMYKEDDLTEQTEEIILKRAKRSVDSAQYSLKLTQERTRRTLETLLPRDEVERVEAEKRAAIALVRTKAAKPAEFETERLNLEKAARSYKQAAEKLADLREDREKMVVKAPIGGILYYGRFNRGKWLGKSSVESALKKGGTVSPKQPVMTIVSPRPLRIRGDVDEKDLVHLRAQVHGKVTPTADPSAKWPVDLESVSVVPIAPGKFDARVAVDVPRNARIVPGMTCKVKFIAHQHEKALTVPNGAVFDVGDDKVVYIQSDSKTQMKKVTVGKSDGKVTEILDGVKEGDQVLLEKP
jgi:multidrug resistance efflux pump